MNNEMKLMLLDAIKLKTASVNRAMKGANAKFATIYQEELSVLHAAETWVRNQKAADK